MSVFHLKYRPQKLEDLDSDSVSKSLVSILSASEIPQSFLFSGPKGAGKTSAARIFAMAMNCLKPSGVEPCIKCDNCLEINNGSSIDIIEIDAASNRGIEDIRALKERAYLLPSKLKKKIFIIDEVHMLTKEAFNALLKLIEEPPKNTIFILCTTDPEKIPDTVLSRLIKVDFKKGSKKELRRSLDKVVSGEKLKIDEEAIKLIIDNSDGSFRNLHKSLNEIVLKIGTKINANQIKEYFSKSMGDYQPEELERDLVSSEIKNVLTKLEILAEGGVDFVRIRERWLRYFQNKLLNIYGVGEGKSEIKAKELQRLINLLINASRIEKEVEIDQLPLELALVEFVNEGDGKIVKQPQTTEKKEAEKKEELKEEVKEIVIKEDKEELIVETSMVGTEVIVKEWGRLLTEIRLHNHSVEAFLRAARPKEVKGNVVVFEVFYPFHKEKLEEAKNRQIVEKCLAKIFESEMFFECTLGKSKKEPLVIKNDTPVEKISEKLAEEQPKDKDIYDIAKEIFG